MDGSNILSVNVPNFVSITIMALAGLFVVSLLMKTMRAKSGAANG